MISSLRWIVPAALFLLFPSVSLAADKVTEIKSAYPPCTVKPTTEAEDQARGHHKLASQAFDAKRWKDASDLWTKAYALDCSRPRVFWNLGQAFEEGGNIHAAVAMYELLAERAPTEVPDDLPPKIHQLRGAAQKLDDEEASKSAQTKPVEAPPKPIETERPLGPLPWILVGSGAGIAVGGAVLLGVGQAQASSAEDTCTDPATRTGCSQDAVDDGEAGELMSQIGQGMLYGGGGLAVLGLVLQFAANGEQPVQEPSVKATGFARDLSFAVVPVDDGAALFMGGRF